MRKNLKHYFLIIFASITIFRTGFAMEGTYPGLTKINKFAPLENIWVLDDSIYLSYINMHKEKWINENLDFVEITDGKETEYFAKSKTLVTYFLNKTVGRGLHSSVNLAYVHFSENIPSGMYAYKTITDENEFLIQNSLSHHNIARCFSLGKNKKMLMELMPVNLEKFLQKNSMSYKKKLEIALAITNGLNNLHENGIVHQDLYEGNILFKNVWDVKLTDFGSARPVNKENDAEIAPQNASPAYMKYCYNQDNIFITSYSEDIWALGLLFYFIAHPSQKPAFTREPDKHKNFSEYLNAVHNFYETFEPQNGFDILIKRLLSIESYQKIKTSDILIALREEIKKNSINTSENFHIKNNQKKDVNHIFPKASLLNKRYYFLPNTSFKSNRYYFLPNTSSKSNRYYH